MWKTISESFKNTIGRVLRVSNATEIKQKLDGLKQALAEKQEKLAQIQNRKFPVVQFHFSTEDYMGAPEKDMEPYKRLLYRYTISIGESSHRARFGRDARIEEPDIIGYIMESDLELFWRDYVARCSDCKRWMGLPNFVQRPAKFEAKDDDCCDICLKDKLEKLQAEIKKIKHEIEHLPDADFIEMHSARLKVSPETIAEYIKHHKATARSRVSKAALVETPRFTICLSDFLTPEEVAKAEAEELKKILVNYPKEFQQIAEAYQMTKDEWILGRLGDLPRWKSVRDSIEKIKLPQSSRLHGILTACGATPEQLKKFEERLVNARESTAMTAAEIIESKTEKVYFSNDPEALVNLGAWGTGSYGSCQNWRVNDYEASYCKAFTNLEDPTVFICWTGTWGKMRHRFLVRARFDATDPNKKYFYVDHMYGSYNNRNTMVALLKKYAATIGYDVAVSSYTDGLASKNFIRLKSIPVDFSSSGMNSYRDLGGWNTGGLKAATDDITAYLLK